MPRQLPSNCQSHTSAFGPGSLRVSAIENRLLAGSVPIVVAPYGLTVITVEPRQNLFKSVRAGSCSFLPTSDQGPPLLVVHVTPRDVSCRCEKVPGRCPP